MATMAARECAKRLGFGLGLRQIGANTPLALVPATQTQGLSNAATASSSFSSSASCCSFSSRSRACVDRNSKGSVSSRVSGLPFVNGGHAVRGLTTKTPDDKGAELLESLEHATGLELAEKEGKARGIDIFTEGEAWLSAPFGTPEKPVSSPNEKDRKCSYKNETFLRIQILFKFFQKEKPNLTEKLLVLLFCLCVVCVCFPRWSGNRSL